jgi:uncharacterized protein
VTAPPFQYLLLKLAARCNLACTYCYWFRDQSVYELPHLLTPAVEDALVAKLAAHVRRYTLGYFTVLFHGGEPLLFGKSRFLRLCERLRAEVGERCDLRFSVTTNGTLIDADWAALLRILNVRVTLSIDGPPAIHDAKRVDLKGGGSYTRVRGALALLRAEGIEPYVLSVCDPSTDPEVITTHFVEDLGINAFDIMLPDATHEDRPPSVSAYYTALFDRWYDHLSNNDVSIRYLEATVRSLLGGDPQCEAIGYGPIQLVTMLPDGALEPLDVLRIAGNASTRSSMSILTHDLQDVASDPVWLSAYEASLTLAAECKSCVYQHACGGGYLPHRWSAQRGYDNPSVYCDDLKVILGHVWHRVAADIDVETSDGDYDLATAIAMTASTSQ